MTDSESSSTPEWAPLVHARTLRVDFRFVAAPDDFDGRALDWAREHVLATTARPEALTRAPDRPRWSVFRDDRHLVAGITCAAEALSGERNRDERGRPLYGFFGYVARLGDPSRGRPIALPARRPEVFAPLYRYVDGAWEVKPYREHGTRPEPYGWRPELVAHRPPAGGVALHSDPASLLLWPEAAAGALWSSFEHGREATSALIGASAIGQVVGGPFCNATVTGQEERRLVRRRAGNARARNPEAGAPETGESARPPRRRREPARASARPRSRGLVQLLWILVGLLLRREAGTGHARPSRPVRTRTPGRSRKESLAGGPPPGFRRPAAGDDVAGEDGPTG